MSGSERESYYGGYACCLLSCMFLLHGCVNVATKKESQSLTLVARGDYVANNDWNPKMVMGKDFWNVLSKTHLRKIWISRMKEINKLPMVKNAAFEYGVNKLTKPNSPEKLSTSTLDSLSINKNVPARSRHKIIYGNLDRNNNRNDTNYDCSIFCSTLF